MAIPVIEDLTTASSVGGTAALSITKPTGTVEGDLIIIIHGSEPQGGPGVDYTGPMYDNSTLKPSGGTTFTELKNCHADLAEDTDAACQVSYKIAGASEPASYTCTTESAHDCVAWCLRISGHNATTPINVTGATTQTTFATSRAVSEVTTTVDDCLVFAFIITDGSDTNPFSTSGTGWEEYSELDPDTSSNGCTGQVSKKEQTTAGATGACTITWNASFPDGACGFQFAVAPGGGLTINVPTGPWR